MQSFFIKNTNVISSITPSTKLGSGGEGTVYSVADDPALCVKIYHEQKRSPELEKKIKAMIEAPPKDPTLAAGHYSICWPSHLVYEDEACTKFLGFAMPLIDKKIFKEYHLLCDKPGANSSACYRLENFGTGFTYLHMYVVALNLASCVTSIHEAGHAIGDLNDKNILVSTKDSKITIVDCDSFEIHGKDNVVFPCSVYMPEYSAPEVIKHETIVDRQNSDRFALAVLIFKLLMLNTHPYSSRGSSVEHLNTPAEKISAGYYPYEEYENLDVSPPTYALPYSIIPPNIKDLFKACFVAGQHDPEKRPTPKEWLIALKENYESMRDYINKQSTMCKTNTLHVYPLHLNECPWCAMKDDYFPEKIINYAQRQKEMMSVFNYLNGLLNNYLGDGKLVEREQQELYTAADKLNIKRSDIDLLITSVKNKNPIIQLGEQPIITNLTYDYRNIKSHNSIEEEPIHIINKFLYDPLTVSIKNTYSFISFDETEITVDKLSNNTVIMTVDFRELVKHYRGVFSIQIPITVTYDNKKMTQHITIKGIAPMDTPHPIKKTSIPSNYDCLYQLNMYSSNVSPFVRFIATILLAAMSVTLIIGVFIALVS